MHFLLLWYDKVPHKTLALMSQTLCMCSARAELSLKLKKDGWVKNRRTDGHPLIADGKTNCRARPKSKCVVDGVNQHRFLSCASLTLTLIT